ncbi:MAG: LysR family transcriptional regulator [Gammaproteobacteria bacterium]|nr:LysR family transcriptional regulator [Gammaproteobacteria bacterium]
MNKLHLSQIARHASLRQLQVFEAIARLGSFTKAADELALTQPTLSIQIRKLTEVIGLPLFEQIGKRVYLTNCGRILLQATRELFDTFSRLDMQMADLKGLKSGHLNLAVVTTAKYFAPRVLGEFCRRYPGIEVALKVTNRERLLERMVDNMDDLYIMGQPPESPEVVFEPFLLNPIVIVAPRNHPLAAEKAIPLERIAQEPFIMREPGSGTRMAIERVFKEHGIGLQVRIELGSNEAIKQIVASGMGIAGLSQHALIWEAPMGEIALLDVRGFPLDWHWYVGYPAGKQLSVVAQAFHTFLQEEGRHMADRRTNLFTNLYREIA